MRFEREALLAARQVPPALLSAVKRDLRPTRPLASPSRRTLAVLPIGIALLAGIPALWRWRAELSALAPSSSWPLSAVEAAAGLAALAAAFHEAVPGRELSRRALAVVLSAVALAVLLASSTHALGLTPAPLATTLRWIWECVSRTTAFSLPALAIVTWLVARAAPGRPALTGALAGLGVGVMADAGLRLMCWDGDVPHVLVAHGGALALVTLVGALSAWLVDHARRR
ncbi:MAG: NrsF family protein [Kofleriaceae bacterium]